MIEVYTWATPNGHKVNIMVEEIGLPYELHPIDISKGEQKSAEYLAVNPNGKIPAIVDREGEKVIRVFESGAILLYLAEKCGKLLSRDPAARMDALGWTFWQVGGLGPMLGQWNHFASRDEKLPYAIERYLDETLRLFGVMDGALGAAEYLAGEYSIADIACYSWAKFGLQKVHKEIEPGKFPNVQAWLDRVGARPAVQKGLSLVGAPR